MTKKVTQGLLLLAMLGILFSSCKKEEVTAAGVAPSLDKLVEIGSLGSGQSCTPLIAGQTQNAGDVCLTDVDTNNDGLPDQLVVTYSTTNGWSLREIHFWVGSTLASMPQTNTGSPKLGQFPYSFSGLTGTTHVITIPFSTLGYVCPTASKYLFVAHAVVSKNGQTETAYGGGDRLLARGNWSMFNSIWISCQPIISVPTASETAWAKLNNYSTCFIDIADLNSNRWGWTNGPLSNGQYTASLIAAAGQCNISNGTVVGTVQMNYNGSSLTVNSITSGINPDTQEPYKLDEVHIYAGSAMIPMGSNGSLTVAPGQLGNVSGALNGVTSYSRTINNLNGNIYVAVHAVVSGFPID